MNNRIGLHRFVGLVFVALLLAGCAVAVDPQSNSKRVHVSLVELAVYEDLPFYLADQPWRYPVICTIPPFGEFHVGARDGLFPQFRQVMSADGTCIGWAQVR